MIQFRKIGEDLRLLPPRKRSTAGPVSYTWVARSRSESTSQFTCTAFEIEGPSPPAPYTSQVQKQFFKIR